MSKNIHFQILNSILLVSICLGSSTSRSLDLGAWEDLRGMSVDRQVKENETILKLSVEQKVPYSWCSIGVPTRGWSLNTVKEVKSQVTNTGPYPIKILFWIRPTQGWDAIGNLGEIQPGESQQLICPLRKVYRDGTPMLNPERVNQLQWMLINAKPGSCVEVGDVKADGHVAAWDLPKGRLEVPDMIEGPPQAGQRVKFQLLDVQVADRYSVLYLPHNWNPQKHYPVIVEYPGNIYYTPNCYSTGRPQQCVIGYGMSKGENAIWVSLPFVDYDRGGITEHQWGNPDDTADYAVKFVNEIVDKYGGDRDYIVLTGFSRGAIACGFIGLRNDQIASLWQGMHCCQHYDGDGWGGADMKSALERGRRLAGISVFHTDNNSEQPRKMLEELGVKASFVSSGLRAHACAMFLDNRPSTQQLRAWFNQLITTSTISR